MSDDAADALALVAAVHAGAAEDIAAIMSNCRPHQVAVCLAGMLAAQLDKRDDTDVPTWVARGQELHRALAIADVPS